MGLLLVLVVVLGMRKPGAVGFASAWMSDGFAQTCAHIPGPGCAAGMSGPVDGTLGGVCSWDAPKNSDECLVSGRL